jgi:hypothetical protein
MRWSSSSITIISFIIGLIFGAGLGWSVSLSLNPQTGPIGNAGIIISIIGLTISIFDLYKRISQEIILQFGEVTIDNNRGYYLRVKRNKGRGKAKHAEAHLTLENKFDYAPTVWADGVQRYLDIGEHQDLLLFRLESDLILFPSAHPGDGYLNNEYSYNDCANKNLKVEILFDNGYLPKPYLKTIAQIVNEATPK